RSRQIRRICRSAVATPSETYCCESPPDRNLRQRPTPSPASRSCARRSPAEERVRAAQFRFPRETRAGPPRECPRRIRFHLLEETMRRDPFAPRTDRRDAPAAPRIRFRACGITRVRRFVFSLRAPARKAGFFSRFPGAAGRSVWCNPPMAARDGARHAREAKTASCAESKRRVHEGKISTWPSLRPPPLLPPVKVRHAEPPLPAERRHTLRAPPLRANQPPPLRSRLPAPFLPCHCASLPAIRHSAPLRLAHTRCPSPIAQIFSAAQSCPTVPATVVLSILNARFKHSRVLVAVILEWPPSAFAAGFSNVCGLRDGERVLRRVCVTRIRREYRLNEVAGVVRV